MDAEALIDSFVNEADNIFVKKISREAAEYKGTVTLAKAKSVLVVFPSNGLRDDFGREIRDLGYKTKIPGNYNLQVLDN